MGASQSQAATIDPNFQMQKYLNQGLNQKQVIMIRTAFESYQPENGYINLEKYRQCLLQSEIKDEVSGKLGNKFKLNFDQFFVVEKEVLLVQLKKNPSIEVDSTQIEPTGFFCPYAQEVVRN